MLGFAPFPLYSLVVAPYICSPLLPLFLHFRKIIETRYALYPFSSNVLNSYFLEKKKSMLFSKYPQLVEFSSALKIAILEMIVSVVVKFKV